MPVEDIMVHTATPAGVVESGEWIEGERDVSRDASATPFGCCLFLPRGSEDAGGMRSRQVSRPTLLYLPTDLQGEPVTVGPNDELVIDAPELAQWTGGNPSRWQVDGRPQPAGPPGEAPIVVQAQLVAVGD